MFYKNIGLSKIISYYSQIESSRPESSYVNAGNVNPPFNNYDFEQQLMSSRVPEYPSIYDNKIQDLRRSLSSSTSMTGDDEYRSGYSINPDTFTFSEVSHSGKSMGMPELGVHMVIPEGALDKGYTEEIFLAVMTDDRDRPRLSDNQTLLSPVILAGPPRVSFRKPIVISFGHCANLSNQNEKYGKERSTTNDSEWELALYHCDSLFSDNDDAPWVKLTTLMTHQSIDKHGKCHF